MIHRKLLFLLLLVPFLSTCKKEEINFNMSGDLKIEFIGTTSTPVLWELHLYSLENTNTALDVTYSDEVIDNTNRKREFKVKNLLCGNYSFEFSSGKYYRKNFQILPNKETIITFNIDN